MVTLERIRRGDVFLVQLDPTRGGEIRKSRPCVVVSPDDLNAHVRTVIVAPLTKGGHAYPFRVHASLVVRMDSWSWTRFVRSMSSGLRNGSAA